MSTFKDAYAVLSNHAETLRNQQEPNIDDLLTIVTEAMAAYKICQERIDAVDAALKKARGEVAATTHLVGDAAAASARDDEAPPPRTPARPASSKPAPSTGFDDMDDDIPF